MTRARLALLVGICLVGGGGCERYVPPNEPSKTATGVLVHYPSNVRTPQAWKGHHFMVNGVPVQPSAKVPESELLTRVGKRVIVTGKWNPGFVWKPGEQEPSAQIPVGPDRDEPMIRGDGIMVESMQELQEK